MMNGPWSIFGIMSGGEPRVFRGPAAFAHRPEHPAFGTEAWFIATDLDDWPLGGFRTWAEAGLWLMAAELVLAAQTAARA